MSITFFLRTHTVKVRSLFFFPPRNCLSNFCEAMALASGEQTDRAGRAEECSSSAPESPHLHLHRIGDVPSVWYIPNYLSAAEESSLDSTIHASKIPWTQVSGRRLQSYGGVVHEKTGVLLTAPLPGWLQALVTRLQSETGLYGGRAPNHVLLNAYLPGEGILPHQDGPRYHPGVCIVSLGAPAILQFRKKMPEGIAPEAAMSVLLMPRSLVCFADAAYADHLHGIDEVEVETLDPSVVNLAAHPELGVGAELPRGRERLSLTVRRVLRVRNLVKR